MPENVLEFEEQRGSQQEGYVSAEQLENISKDKTDPKIDDCPKQDRSENFSISKKSSTISVSLMSFLNEPENDADNGNQEKSENLTKNFSISKKSSTISVSLMSFLNEPEKDADNGNQNKVENLTENFSISKKSSTISESLISFLNEPENESDNGNPDNMQYEICKGINLDTDDSALNQCLVIVEKDLDNNGPQESSFLSLKKTCDNEQEKSTTENKIDKETKEVNYNAKNNEIKHVLDISDISAIESVHDRNCDVNVADDKSEAGSAKFSDDESDDQRSSVQDELEKLDISDDGNISF